MHGAALRHGRRFDGDALAWLFRHLTAPFLGRRDSMGNRYVNWAAAWRGRQRTWPLSVAGVAVFRICVQALMKAMIITS